MAELAGRQALEAAITELDRQIGILRETRQALANILDGVGVAPGVSPSGNSSVPHATPVASVGEPLAHVREQEFHGLSKAEAARLFLTRVGPQKTGTILAAIVKGGLQQESKFPESSLYTTLARHSAFVSLKRNWWDLSERRPDLLEQQREQKRRLTRKIRIPRKRRLQKKPVAQEHQEVPVGAE